MVWVQLELELNIFHDNVSLRLAFSKRKYFLIASFTNSKQVSHRTIITVVPLRFPFTSVCVVFL